MPPAEGFQLEVSPSDSILSVKQKIEAKSGVPAAAQKLVFSGVILGDETQTVATCGLPDGASITAVLSAAPAPPAPAPLDVPLDVPHALPAPPAKKRITVTDIGGKVSALEVEDGDSILSVKEKLAEKGGVATDAMRLVFGGKELANDRTVGDYNIQTDSKCVRPPRPPPQAPPLPPFPHPFLPKA